MNIVTAITGALEPMGLPMAVGLYKVEAGKQYPDAYIVLTPLGERNGGIADNAPLTETAAADVNLYLRGDYQPAKDRLKALLEGAGFYLEGRRYVAFEADTGHHHYVITAERTEVL